MEQLMSLRKASSFFLLICILALVSCTENIKEINQGDQVANELKVICDNKVINRVYCFGNTVDSYFNNPQFQIENSFFYIDNDVYNLEKLLKFTIKVENSMNFLYLYFK